MFIEYHYRAFAGDCGIEDNGGYIDATESQWLENYQMFSYVNDEFYELIVQNFNVDIHRIGIFG
jgi:S-formylglutathione hydrolase FrmB